MRVFLALYCCLALGAQAETFSAKVIVVMDGDTVMALRGCAKAEPQAPHTLSHSACTGVQKVRIRLANIDAPEKDQEFGKQSRDSLLEMVGRKQVRIDSRAVDQYGRIVGLISVDGLNVNLEQVKRGMAWATAGWRRNRPAESGMPEGQTTGGVSSLEMNLLTPSAKTYLTSQRQARQARLGLWAQPDPQAPWLWRRLHPSVRTDVKCGTKHRCSQMDSCDEARFFFIRCGEKALDGNHDGSPCESLCSGK